HLLALGVVFVAASRLRCGDVARAVLPAAALVAAYGIAQVAGLEWPAGYAVGSELGVATLGNRNVASEVAAVALGIAGWSTARGGRPLTAATMVVLAAYLGLNGSRAGLAGGGLALALVAWQAWRTGAPRALAVLLAAAVLVAGHLGRPQRVVASAAEAASPVAAEPPSTIDLRVELWRGGLAMLQDAPLLGHGTGQFRYAYPAFRSQAEIEQSTFGRRFPTVAEDRK